MGKSLVRMALWLPLTGVKVMSVMYGLTCLYEAHANLGENQPGNALCWAAGAACFLLALALSRATHAWVRSLVVLMLLAAPMARAQTSGLGVFVGIPDNGSAAGQTAATNFSAVSQSVGTPTLGLSYVDMTLPESQWASDAQWVASKWASTSWSQNLTPVVGIPMAAQGENADTSFRNIANGSEDAVYNGIFQAWANAGYKNIVIRPGFEMSGNWMPWSVTPANAADYRAAFQRIAQLAHAFSGATVQVVWNPSVGSTPVSLADLYPGSGSVDVIGLDTYGAPVNTSTSPSDPSTSPDTITLGQITSFANAQGKPLALPETGGTDTTFPAQLAAALKASGTTPAFIGLWDNTDSSTGDLTFTNNQASAAAWGTAVASMFTGTPAQTPSHTVPSPTAPSPGVQGITPVNTGNYIPASVTPVPLTTDNTAIPPNPPAPCLPGATGPATSVFHVVAGQIIGPDGKPFIARGIGVMEFQMPSLAQIQAVFPGVNFIRLAIYDYPSPDKLRPFIEAATAAGIVVEPEDHVNNAGNAGGSQGVVFTGAVLANELAWYQSMAVAFKGNPYVWLGTDNEPSQTPSAAALSTWQRQTYQAIRGTGNQNPILVEMNCWATACGAGYTASAYAQMTNIIWDVHFYNWIAGYSADQPTNEAMISALASWAQQITSADGAVPVLLGEYGNSTSGTEIDAGGVEAVAAVINAGSTGRYGSAAWAWGSGNPGDGLLDGNGGASSPYGQQVKLFVGTSIALPTACQATAEAQQALVTAVQTLAAPPGTQAADTSPDTTPVPPPPTPEETAAQQVGDSTSAQLTTLRQSADDLANQIAAMEAVKHSGVPQ